MKCHLLVTNDFPPKIGGIQSYLWELWRRLDPSTFAVLTASSHPRAGSFDAQQAAQGIWIDRVAAKTIYLPTPTVRARIRRSCARAGASMVVLDPVLPLGLVGPKLGVPYGVVVHGAEMVAPARVPGTRDLLRHVLGRAALVVCAGAYPRAEVERILAGRGVRTGPLVVEIPPGVDSDRIVPLDPHARDAARGRLGLAQGAPLVASVSRLVPRKGMDVLIEAARRLSPSFPELTVAIAGTGRDADRLSALVQRTDAPVRLLGAVSEADKAALLASADAFAMICRSRWWGLEEEGFGIVFLEAAAAGIPQIAGQSGGAADAVEDGVTGYVVRRPQDPGDVAAALRLLLADDVRRKQMGDAARRRACDAFSYDTLATKLAAALAEVQG